METFRCDGLCKSFDGIHALASVHLQFPPSGIVAIIGPNGAGKTTLLNILTGFLCPEAGHCFLGNREITALSPHRIAQLGVARTFQDLRLILQTSALENVLLARPCQKGERMLAALLRFGVAEEEARNREEALRLLRFVGLAEKADDLAGELSYGQQKPSPLPAVWPPRPAFCCLMSLSQASILRWPPISWACFDGFAMTGSSWSLSNMTSRRCVRSLILSL